MALFPALCLLSFQCLFLNTWIIHNFAAAFLSFINFFVETPRSVPPRWFEIVKLKMQLIFNVIESRWHNSFHNKSRLWREPHRMPFRPWHWRLGVFFRCCVPDEGADRFWASEMVKLLLGWDFLTGTLRPLTVTFTSFHSWLWSQQQALVYL